MLHVKLEYKTSWFFFVLIWSFYPKNFTVNPRGQPENAGGYPSIASYPENHLNDLHHLPDQSQRMDV